MCGAAGQREAMQAWLGLAWHRMAGLGKAGKVWNGMVRRGVFRLAWHGMSGSGGAGQGWQVSWRGGFLSRTFGRLNILKPETKIALEMVANGATVYRAAKTTGVAQSTVARAMAKKLCPYCGRSIRNIPDTALPPSR